MGIAMLCAFIAIYIGLYEVYPQAPRTGFVIFVLADTFMWVIIANCGRKDDNNFTKRNRFKAMISRRFQQLLERVQAVHPPEPATAPE
jgi:hypothetical protein